VPPGQEVVLIVKGPPAATMVTCAVAVTEPAALVAVSVYVVVAFGLTLVEPLPDAEAKEPGEMVILVAPDVLQLSVLLEPEVMLEGLAMKELIVGLLGLLVFTVTVAVEVTEPDELVAVSV
jgi:hypothetical protein